MRLAYRSSSVLIAVVLAICVGAVESLAQTTAFTYQGKLADSGNPANGSYDFQFKLFDTVTVGTGTQQGATVTVSNVTVAGGIFTVQLDFGACPTCFDGTARFLEIAVKATSGSTFTTLGPRQPVTSNPYAIRSLNAVAADGLSVACVSCVTSSQIQSVQGSQVSGTIPVASVPAGSSNYVQNTTSQQAATNFNISGNGTAGGTLSGNVVNATTQFNIGGNQILKGDINSSSTFVGIGAGAVNTGGGNSFFGYNAGNANTTAIRNSFFGASAGLSTTAGGSNSFFGIEAGKLNTTGAFNSFFGDGAGVSNTTANNNSFFGYNAGLLNTTEQDNTFLGYNAGLHNGMSDTNNFAINNTFVGSRAGQANTTGGGNTFVGSAAGNANTAGYSNSFFGANAGQNNTTGQFNSFFGFHAGNHNMAGCCNSFFGSGAGASNTTQHDNTFIGSDAGVSNGTNDPNILANYNAFVGSAAGRSNTAGFNNSFFGAFAGYSNGIQHDNTFIGSSAGYNNGMNDTNNFAINNTFVGSQAGQANTTGGNNTFVGSTAGSNNTTGVLNSFFGSGAGLSNTDACCNAFFGATAGQLNTSGGNNAFFGYAAGVLNTTGNFNAFFGSAAGNSNAMANNNAFFGASAGQQNTNGSQNAFFGASAGSSNTAGLRNTIIGGLADFSGTNPTGNDNTLLGFFSRVPANVSNATAIGAFASATQSNTLILGGITGVNFGTSVNVGIGVTAPTFKLHVIDTGNTGLRVETGTSGGTVASYGANGDFQVDAVNIAGGRLIVKQVGNVGIGTNAPNDKLEVNGIIRLATLGGAGSTPLCRNASNQISTCSSSLRYKTNIAAYTSGLTLIKQLQPITFDWKADGKRDVGFGAEDVARVNPLFVTYNAKGEVEGVKYDRLSAAFVNAFKEQQAQIEQQQQQIDQYRQQLMVQQRETESLKRLVCLSHPGAAICKMRRKAK